MVTLTFFGGVREICGNKILHRIYLDFFSMGELIDIDPHPGLVMLHSQTEPFNEEMEFVFGRFQNWLKRFGLS